MEALRVVPVGDIDALIASDGMRVNSRRRVDAVLPFLLHLGMHDEQRIVREMNGHLPLGICSSIIGIGLLLVISGENFSYPELPSNPKTQAANDSSWSQVGELIRMITNTFTSSLVAVRESCVWNPLFWRLVFELLASWVVMPDSLSDFFIDSLLYVSRDFTHLRCDLANILWRQELVAE